MVLVALTGAILLFYFLGARGVRVGGASSSFGRERDAELYRIDGELAFHVAAPDFNGRRSVALVRYSAAQFPYGPVCGSHRSAGWLVAEAYRLGDWIYSPYPDLEGTDAFNLRTKEALEIDVAKPANYQPIDPSTVPAYRARGFTFDPKNKIDGAQVASHFAPLRNVKESCIVITSAMALVHALWVGVGIIVLLVFIGRRSRRG